jgi:Subtilase family
MFKIYHLDQMTWKRSVAIAAILAVTPVSASVFAQDNQPFAEAVIGFEGGHIGNDTAQVIKQFSEINETFATRPFQPEETTGLCIILEQKLLIPRELCTESLLNEVKALNLRKGIEIDVNAINPKTGVVLPDVKAQVREVDRYFDTADELQKDRVELIDKNWKSVIAKSQSDVLNSKSVSPDSNPGSMELRKIRKLEWKLPLNSQDDYYGAIVVRKQLSLEDNNLTVGVEKSAPQPKAAYSSPDAVYQRWCVNNESVPGEGFYEEMAAHFYGPPEQTNCEKVDGQEVKSELAIIDQPIARHPDLQESLGMAASVFPPQCVPAPFLKATAHGNMLASIVASSRNGHGFAGIAPGAKITHYSWTRTEGSNQLLNEFLEANQTVPVILFASNFVLEPPFRATFETGVSELKKRAQDAVWKWDAESKEYHRELADSEVRFALDSSGKVMTQKSLFVVAAGQVDGGGRVIHDQSELAPQNIGEMDEVLVVAACDKCTSPLPKLSADSNRAENGRSVSVMAPGGTMPFYVSETQTAFAPGGTSAAAAFAAGLAAKMSACYPSYYRLRPERLKERIVLTSFPVSDASALDQVVGGVIDTSVAMLDPGKTWLKTVTQQKPRQVEVNQWCSDTLDIVDDNGNQVDINLKQTRRLAMVEDRVVQRIVKRGPKIIKIKRPNIIARAGPGALSDRDSSIALITEVDGAHCLLSGSNLRDLIVGGAIAGGIINKVGDCGDEIPLCN